MSKDKKRVFKNTSIVEYKSLERYFEEMALKGWLIEKMGFGMIFRKIQPQALTFNVALLTAKTMLDWPNSEETSTYDEFCKSAGWELASENQIYRIYYRLAKTNGANIYTDDEDIYKTIKKSFFKSEFILMLLPLLYVVLAFMNASNMRYDVFNSNLSMFNLMMPYFVTFIIWMITLPSLYWVIINSNRIRCDKPLFYYNSRWIKNKNRLQYAVLIIYLLLIIGALFYDPYNNMPFNIIVVTFIPMALILMFVWLFKKFIQKKTYPLLAKISILIAAWVVSMVIGMGLIFSFVGSVDIEDVAEDDIKIEANRLTLEELGITGPSNTKWISTDSSLLVPLSYEYDERLEDKDNYKSIRVEAMHMANEKLKDWVVNKVLEEERERYDEEILYNPDLKNYVKEISGYEDYAVELYNLSEGGYKLMLVKDKEVYLISYSGILEADILKKILVGLFN